MSATLKVEIDTQKVMGLLRGLPPSALQGAWRRTLRKTANWIKGQTAKAISGAARIPQKLIRRRLYFFLRSGNTGKVWLGLNAIEAHRLGTPRQTRRGVTVGRHRFEGAWMKKKTGPEGVYRRKGRGRMPYEKVKYDWSGSGEDALKSAAARSEARLMTVLRQEVNYELQKAAGRAR
ncbi:phage tail protein [Verminephrobacter aporrectodeae subsp. tuberculatae]|uniref:Phage tail protein n=1 Tax=Verminephrobacter aporrectodeae subsp. tuberculatae TaxID=1110392 RepID=A0ABT3KMT9_9BURK|nr:phage tail protein [Verminephrobacter aporrectodeae]MCW5319632.1 phage tail protein [Verminephrobacter aporrectodeae subsp. tuberculatae]